MNTFNRTRLLLAAAALGCAFFSGSVLAGERTVTVALHVSTAGLDLSQAADAHTFYTRLENAAWVACTRGDRVGLEPAEYVTGCYEKALGQAVRATKIPLVTQIYLTTHTYAQASAFGIGVPTQVAGR
jgi:UrcA family protein